MVSLTRITTPFNPSIGESTMQYSDDTLSMQGLSSINTQTASIVDYRMITPRLAEVIAHVTGKMNKAEMFDRILGALNGLASPVRESFRWVDPGSTVIGFVNTNHEVQPIEQNDPLTGYKNVAANMYLDDEENLWSLEETAGGKYLVRNGTDDLPTVLSSVKRSRPTGAPMLASLASVDVTSGELVAFVDHQNDVSYGMVIGSKQGDADTKAILAFGSGKLVRVHKDLIVTAVTVEFGNKDKIGDRPVTAGVPDPEKMIEYYRKAYSYNADYLEKVIRDIEEQAAA